MSSDEESLSGSDNEGSERSTKFDVSKYQMAAASVNATISRLISECTPGKKIVDLCNLGDKIILEELAKHKTEKGVERGIAFPTSISPNHIVGHFSPESNDTTCLNEGDLVKIDLGAQVDGFIAVSAHSLVVGAAQDQPITGRKADLLCAINIAGDVILRILKPGNTNSEVTEIIKQVAQAFHVNVVEGVLSHQMQRFVIDGTKVIINKVAGDQNVEEFTFEEDDVFAIDIVFSTGEGKTREENTRPTIYKRAIDQTYLLKLQAARKVFSEINKKFPALPFTIRSLEQKHVRYGLGELEKHGLVHIYPTLYERQGEYVAQLKYTVLIGSRGAVRITETPIPYVQSQYSVDDPELKQLLSSDTKEKNKGKKKQTNKRKKDETVTSTTITNNETDGTATMDTS